MKLNNYNKFISELEKTYIKEKINGDSGFVTLLSIKEKYFNKIMPFIKEELFKKTDDFSPEEMDYLCEKLYTFFSSYLNETGTPFFANTEIHKNIYEKIYSDAEDVSLFWKTQKLYYVKSEANYKNMEIEIPEKEIFFSFDTSGLKRQKANEKKELIFYLSGAIDNKLFFKVMYKEQPKYEKIKKYLKIDDTKEVQKYIKENYPDIKNDNIIINTNGFDLSLFNKTKLFDNIFVNEDKDLLTVELEFAPSKIDQILYFCKKLPKLRLLWEENFNKAFATYKKQNEIDYFIHKDAENFLKEQLNLYFYNYFMNDLETDFAEAKIKVMQRVKQVAGVVIEYIAKFENELKFIWEKPKFVRKSDYVLSLDKLENHINIIEKIIKDKGFEEQKKEWQKLGFINEDFNKEEILKNGLPKGFSLNHKYKFLPIDTKYFKDLKWDILGCFDNLDDLIDGTLIKSDNWQALNTILPKFKEQIQTIYIDPPFNLGNNADFLYKVNYKDSNWITLLENRIRIARDLLNDKGSIFVRCDYNGNMLVRFLLDEIFGESNFGNEIIANRFKRQLDDLKRLNFSTESLFYFAKSDFHKLNKIYKNRKCSFCGSDIAPNWRPMNSPGIRWSPVNEEYFNMYSPDNLKLEKGKYVTKARIIKGLELLPPNGRHWTFSQEKIFQLEKEERIRINSLKIPEYLQSEKTPIDNNWTDLKGYAFGSTFSTENAEELLERVIKSSSLEGEIICDFFLGSGTTTAVAHKLKRKWLGVEMGEHFYDVIIPRMKKILFYDKSGVSKEDDVKENYNADNAGGFFKYYELEQYEEALAKCRYDNQKEELDKNKKELKHYDFLDDQKQLDAIEIDYKNECAKIHFENLYSDVDIAETISNLTGWKIKTLQKDYAVFDKDGKKEKIIFSEMTYEKYPFIKPLIWWKSL